MNHVYIRISSRSQSTRSQRAELQREVKRRGIKVKVYTDKASGKSMDRPAWRRLWQAVQAGDTIIVWRVDRLGRTVVGLSQLFKELIERRINLISVRDNLDLSTASGRLQANILASVAEYELEVRRERQAEGISAALAAGETWGGRTKGSRNRDTEAKIADVKTLHKAGRNVSEIRRTTGLSRTTIYSIIG